MDVNFTEQTAHILQPTGILDSVNGTWLRHEVEALVKAGVRTVVVDCSQLELIDSSGFGNLVACLKVLRSVNGNLFLSDLNESVQVLLALTGMDTVFTVLSGE